MLSFLLILNLLHAQENTFALSQDIDKIKIYPTNLSRDDIIKGNPVNIIKPNKAYFKVTLKPSGKLLRVEYVINENERNNVKKLKETNQIILLYKKWDPRKERLIESLTEEAAKGVNHFRATEDTQGRVLSVESINREGKRLWTYSRSKKYTTKLSRKDIITGKTVQTMNPRKAYFKAAYSSAGKLLSIEYLPAKKDLFLRKKEKIYSEKTILYANWNPGKRSLKNPLTKKQARRKNHYRAKLDSLGEIEYVDYIKRSGKRLWTYSVYEQLNGENSAYEMKLNMRKPLIEFDKFLFSNKLSEVRQGWRIRFILNEALRPFEIQVIDNHDDLIYYYTFNYNPGQVVSSYYRADSLIVGSHQVDYESNNKVSRITYFNIQGIMERAVTYEYFQESEEMMVSQINSRGQVIERRRVKN